MSFTPSRFRLRGDHGGLAEVSRYGQIIVAARKDDILCRFEYSNSSVDVAVTTTGTGASSNSNSQAVASTGAGVGKCSFNSVNIISYKPAHEMYAYGSLVFTAGAANTTQRWGPFDDNDGFYIGFSGTSFGVAVRKSAADTFTAQTAWNKDKCDGTGPSGFVLDKTKNNQYRITYGWLGIAPATFSVYGGEALGWVLFHVIDQTNQIAVPIINSPNFKIRWEVERTSGAGAVTLAVGCISGGGLEMVHSNAGHRVFASSSLVALGAGVETLITAVRNKSTYQSKTNKITLQFVYLGAATDGTKNVRLTLTKNATISGGAWADANTANSVVDINTTATFSGGTVEMIIPMLKADTLTLDLGVGRMHVTLLPGETLVISGLSSASNDAMVAVRWEEFFA